MKTKELILDISHTAIDDATIHIRFNLVKLGYSFFEDYHITYDMYTDSLIIKIYSQKMFEDKRVKELLLEYMI